MRSVSIAVAILAAVAIVIASFALITVKVAPARQCNRPHPCPTATPRPTPSPTSSPTPSLSPTPSPSPTSTPGGGSLTLPVRAAFYYPWFPEAWNQQGFNPFTRYHPTLGFYDSSRSTVIAQHVAWMQSAGLQAGIASWWGQGTPTDGRIPALLANAGSFRWSLYYEPEGQGNPSIATISGDLDYIASHYAASPAFLHVGGRPVLFVYGDSTDSCTTASNWRSANAGRFYIVLKVFSGYRLCADQPDSWHQYGPAVREDHQGVYSFTISPGFWKSGESAPRLTRDPAAWNTNVCDMLASGATWQLVTTFNEWGEGTAIEPATEWQSGSGYGTYLDTLRSPQCATPSPTATATLSATPAPIPSAPTPTPTASPSSTAGSVVVTAAGDIACDPSSNSGAPAKCDQAGTAALIGSTNPNAVLTLGDNQYEYGALTAFQQSYGPSWGQYLAKTHPAIGNHEYLTTNAAGYFGYFGSRAPSSYYSFDVGTWHFISLNSECSHLTGGCAAGGAQETWLKSDLAAHPNQCVLAYWHEPRWSNGEHGNATQMTTFWNDLVAAHADIVLSGHNHDYERYAPMNANGQPVTDGVREFVVGTGGKNHYAISAPMLAGEQAQNDSTFGVLKLTLSSGSYAWQFLPAAGYSFSDAGTGTCH